MRFSLFVRWLTSASQVSWHHAAFLRVSWFVSLDLSTSLRFSDFQADAEGTASRDRSEVVYGAFCSRTAGTGRGSLMTDYSAPLTNEQLILEVATGKLAFANKVKLPSVKALWEGISRFTAETLRSQKVHCKNGLLPNTAS